MGNVVSFVLKELSLILIIEKIKNIIKISKVNYFNLKYYKNNIYNKKIIN